MIPSADSVLPVSSGSCASRTWPIAAGVASSEASVLPCFDLEVVRTRSRNPLWELTRLSEITGWLPVAKTATNLLCCRVPYPAADAKGGLEPSGGAHEYVTIDLEATSIRRLGGVRPTPRPPLTSVRVQGGDP